MSEQELLPCPSCKFIDEVTIDSSVDMGKSTIHCNDCGLIMQASLPEEELIKIWNTRTLPPEAQAVVDAAIEHSGGCYLEEDEDHECDDAVCIALRNLERSKP